MTELEYQIEADIEEQLLKNPYNCITEYAEGRLTKIGRKIFSYLVLQPVSLFAPDIPNKEGVSKANLHFLLLGPPSSGKTSCALLMRDFNSNPYLFQDVTGAKIVQDLLGKDKTSLICTDVDSIFRDMELIKILEGILGEEHMVARFNMKSQSNFSVNATFLGCGLFESLRENIRYGFLQRTIPLVIFHTKEEKVLIVQAIKDGMFATGQKMSFMDIKWFYNKIAEVQKNHNDKFPKIDGYLVDDKVKNELFRAWIEIMEKNQYPEDQYLTREFYSIMKYMCNSAILNMFNREIVKQNQQRLIVPNRHDIGLAKSLFNNEMKAKYNILTLSQMASNIKRENAIKFYEYVRDNDEISYEYKQIGKIFAEQKIEKKIRE